ncbi:DNAH6 [Symbiodinium sp. CCMP2456]|nr:DNAH6 [Symbiodinium sp. CCMP2456]
MLEEAQSHMETLMNELDAGVKRAGLVSQVLHGGLFAEAGSWEKQLAALTRSSESLPGECMFAAVCLAYLGPVAPSRRPLWEESLKSLWAEYDFNFSDPVHHEWEVESVRSWDDVDVDPSGSNVDSASEHGAQEDGSLWTLPSFLFDEVSEQEWNAQGLPAALAVSAALALKVPLMPLCLDPHEQACRWLRKVIPSLTVTHAASPKLSQALSACRQEGKPLLVLGCRAVLAPSLLQYLSEESEAKSEDLPLATLPPRSGRPGPEGEEKLEKDGAGQTAQAQEELEAEEGAFSKDCEFRLYLLTADKEMELPARVQIKIATINFTADQSALDDFFLVRLAQQPQGEATELLSFVQNQREFLLLEDQLLSQLTEREGGGGGGGELFEEEDSALAAVATSFGRVQELREALGEAVQNLKAQLEKTRSIYSDLAERCSRLFQSLDGLATSLGGTPFLCSLVDIGESASAACQALLKQQSLVAFGQDTLLSTAASMMVLTSSSLWAVASRVLRRFAWSFFRHQLPLLLIHTALLLEPQEPALLDFLLGGDRAVAERTPNAPPPSSSPDLGLWPRTAWRRICALAELQPTFRDLPRHIQENLDSWRKALDTPSELSTASSSYYPAPFNELSDGFSRVLLVSTLQPALASRELLLYALQVLRGGDGDDEGMAVEVSEPVPLEEALNSALILSDRKGASGNEPKEEGRRNSEAPAPRKKSVMLAAADEVSEERSAALQSSASRKMSFRKKPPDVPETSASKSPRKKSMVDGPLESSASISSRVSKSSGAGLERKKSMADQDSGSPRSPSMGKKMERNRSMVDRSGTNTLSRTGSMESLALESDAGTVAGESDFGVSARRRRREARPKKGVTRPLLLVTALDVEPGRVLSQLAAAQPLEQFIGAKQQELKVINCGRWQAQSGTLLQSIQDAYKRGRWLLIEHIHLVPSWLPQLDALLATILEDGPDFFDRSQGSALPGFRLFLSVPSETTVSHAIPAALVLKCVRVAWELPRGSKALLQRAGAVSKAKETKGAKEHRLWESCAGIDQGRLLLVSLARFQALLQEHRSCDQERAFHVALQLFEDLCAAHARSEKSEKPLEAREGSDRLWAELCYHVTQVFYGFVSEISRRCLVALFHALREQTPMSRSALGAVHMDFQKQSFESALEFLGSQNELGSPSLQQAETESLLAVLNSEELLGSARGGGDASRNGPRAGPGGPGTSGLALALHLLEELPAAVASVGASSSESSGEDEDEALPRAVVMSLNSFLQRELLQATHLLRSVRQSLEDLIAHLEGESFSDDLEAMLETLLAGSVPESWSLGLVAPRRALGSWTEDVARRVGALRAWELSRKAPCCFYLSDFLNPQGFLIATLQGTARLRRSSVERMHFQHRVEHLLSNAEEVRQQLKADHALLDASFEGVFLAGLWLEGASWSRRKGILEEKDLHSRQRWSALPVLRFNPVDGPAQEPLPPPRESTRGPSKGPAQVSGRVQEALRRRHAGQGLQGLGLQRGQGQGGSGAKTAMSLLAGKERQHASGSRSHHFSCPLLPRSPFHSGGAGLWSCTVLPLDNVALPMGSCESQDLWLLRDTAVVIHIED